MWDGQWEQLAAALLKRSYWPLKMLKYRNASILFSGQPRGADGGTCMRNHRALTMLLSTAVISNYTLTDCSACETELPPCQMLTRFRAKNYHTLFIHRKTMAEFWWSMIHTLQINKAASIHRHSPACLELGLTATNSQCSWNSQAHVYLPLVLMTAHLWQ